LRAASCVSVRAPRNIGVGEILRCAQNDDYGGLREAKRTHICYLWRKKPALEWCRLFCWRCGGTEIAGRSETGPYGFVLSGTPRSREKMWRAAGARTASEVRRDSRDLEERAGARAVRRLARKGRASSRRFARIFYVRAKSSDPLESERHSVIAHCNRERVFSTQSVKSSFSASTRLGFGTVS
jgi:hypothetical protein